MIPGFITSAHILEAIKRIDREGIPSRRRSRGYCLVANSRHVPPKYVIALAHRAAAGTLLSSDQFSGGVESNDFLGSRGFVVVECNCGGSVEFAGRQSPPRAPEIRRKTGVSTRHSERCPECKKRVQELLERIYGTCLPNHRFRWPTVLASYTDTAIGCTLRSVAEALKSFRGFGVSDFVRSQVLAPCDFWVPEPGFIVEFDESQHFTKARALALSMYRGGQSTGFSVGRWMALCEHHDAKDNNPPFRDEQRAWYDTLRDLVPPLRGLQPTVRLYASDMVWCSLDPDSRKDRKRFLSRIDEASLPASRPGEKMRSATGQSRSALRVAMVFPKTYRKSSGGIPPSGEGAQEPIIPSVAAFAREGVDLVLFPEGYIRSSDRGREMLLSQLALDLGAPLLVGAIDSGVDSTGRAWQVLLRFDPDGLGPTRIYVKHSTAEAVAFERPNWEPGAALPTFELNNVRVGATICHDHYLGLLPRYLARQGAQLWVNPSFDNVVGIKWSSVLRLRAVENRFFALCTLHDNAMKRSRTHPFAFSPDGRELWARQAGREVARPVSECREAGNIYMVDLDMAQAGEALDWSRLPPAIKPKRVRKGIPRKPVRAALRAGRPSILASSGWKAIGDGQVVDTVVGLVYVEVIRGERILDAAACFRVLDCAKQANATPVIWNHWERLPTDAERLAMLMMGRAIECCAPIVISDSSGIQELVELANRNKIPVRRTMESSGEALIDLEYAWGLSSAFKMVAGRVPASKAGLALERYRSLGKPQYMSPYV